MPVIHAESYLAQLQEYTITTKKLTTPRTMELKSTGRAGTQLKTRFRSRRTVLLSLTQVLPPPKIHLRRSEKTAIPTCRCRSKVRRSKATHHHKTYISYQRNTKETRNQHRYSYQHLLQVTQITQTGYRNSTIQSLLPGATTQAQIHRQRTSLLEQTQRRPCSDISKHRRENGYSY